MSGFAPRLHLPYGEWPPEDQRLWEGAVGGNDDPFAGGAGAHLSAASQKYYLFGWRRWLGFLALDEPTALESTPAERITLERLRRFAAHLAETNLPQSVAGQVDAFYKAARMMLPERDWAWLKEIKARLYAVPPTVRAVKPVITSLQLLDLGLQLMDAARPATGAYVCLRHAVLYRDGLMIALLAFVPMRRKNVAALATDRHLVRVGDSWFVIVGGNETKTGSALEFEIPDVLRTSLDEYLHLVRPRLLGKKSCPGLWVSAKGCVLSYSAIGPIVSRHSQARLGLHIAPHDVRDAAATLWAIAAPSQIGVARDLCTHADLRPLDKHYNRARGLEASRAYAKRIEAIRKQGRRRRSRAGQAG
jgi:integrase